MRAGRGRDVDRVVAGAGPNDERERSRFFEHDAPTLVLRTTRTSAAVSRIAAVSASS